jgi:transcriptional regulator with XRE-family HTH domain
MKSLPACVPSVQQVRRCLEVLGYAGIKQLAADCGLHVGTLNKIRRGETEPQLRTVHKFWPHLPRKARVAG